LSSARELAAIVQHPLVAVDPQRAANLQVLGVADSFTISLELSFYAGLVLSFPLIVIFLAEFMLPALTPKEKAMIFPAAALWVRTLPGRCGIQLFRCPAANLGIFL
jgi:sec-independent protein translocase protein TatC